MEHQSRRESPIGRWAPLVFYAIVVLGWFTEGILAGAGARLWLILVTLPVPALFLWRTGRTGG